MARAVLLAALGFAAATRERPVTALATGMAVTLGAGATLTLALAAGWWLDATTALAALALAIGTGAALRLVDHRRRAANLARYHAPRLVEHLAGSPRPDFDGRAQQAVVIFADVAGFTAHSETLGPEGTADFLRRFHRHVERAAEATNGVIEQFAGDGAMVLFGLPDPDPGDAVAALRFVDQLRGAIAADPAWPGLGLRFGGHAGEVEAGLLGGTRHRHVSVSGDVVNTASRLVEIAKSLGVSIALSGALVTAARAARAAAATDLGLAPRGAHPVRGRAAPLDIWTGGAPARTAPDTAPPARAAPRGPQS